jgi:hypothetical protein
VKKQSCIVNLTQKRNKNLKDIQVGFIALNKMGSTDRIFKVVLNAVHDATEIA